MPEMQIALCVLLLVAIALIIYYRPRGGEQAADVTNQFNQLYKLLDKLTYNFKDDFKASPRREQGYRKGKQDRVECYPAKLPAGTHRNLAYHHNAK